MEKAEILLQTWHLHDGREAKKKQFQNLIDDSYQAKTYIRDTFFGGKDKIEFEIDEPVELTFEDAVREVEVYADRQTKHRRIWNHFSCMDRNLLREIFSNIKTEKDASSSHELARLLLAKEFVDYFTVREMAEKLYEEDFLSPKLTKQIIAAGEKFEIDKDHINNILSVFSQVQKFAPKENNKKVKVVLSVDPLDFLTASINSYNWRSCTIPDGEHASMPLALLLDKYTVIAYIESDKTRYSLFTDEEKVYTSSNKKLRRFIHFSENFHAVLLSRTYPDHNPAFNNCLISFLGNHGFEIKEFNDFFSKSNIDFGSDHVYDDISYTKEVVVLGETDDFMIGVDPFCLQCGASLNEGTDTDYQVEKGLCCDCAEFFGYYDNNEDIDWDEDDWD